VSFSLRTALTFTAVSAICVTAAGCGGSGGGGGSSSSSSSHALAGLSAKQVLSQSVSDLKSASSFHMAGTVNQGGSIRVDLTYSRGTGCKGTLGIGSKGSISLLVIGGTAWLKPDHAYWKSYAGSSASSVIALIGGKYLKAATSSSNVSGLAQLCNANSLASSFTSPRDIVKGGTSTINGQQALALKDPAKSSAMYVTDTTSPQILRVTSVRSGSSGRIDFTGYGNAVTLTPPPASKTIDGARYGF
jgi:hypothetical protein